MRNPSAVIMTLILLLAESSFAQSTPVDIRPHPDALPNTHKPGEVDNPKLVPFIVKDKRDLPGIVVDETEATLVGQWRYSTHTPPYVGLGYLHDQKQGKGKSSVTFRPDLPRAGLYEVRLSHCYNIRRSTNTPVTIHHADGESTLRINQQDVPEHKRLFRTLGRFRFNDGKQGWVRISTAGTDDKYVIADAVQFIPIAGTGDTTPVATVRKEIYVRNEVSGKAPWVYAFPGKGGYREEIHTKWTHDDQVRGYGDSPQEPHQRVSHDNGRTWSRLTAQPPWMTYHDKVTVLDWKFCGIHDPASGRLVSLSIHHVRDMRQGPPRMIYNHALVRTSTDGGFGETQTLKYEEGDDLDLQNVLNPKYLENNTGYPGQSILRLSNGNLLIPVTNSKIPADVEDVPSPRARWPSKGTIGSLCYAGRWDKDTEQYVWKAGRPVWLPRSIAFNGLLEADVAELSDGRILIVWRITKTRDGNAHKWFSVSNDRGMTFSEPRIFGYTDGTVFFSTSTFHRLFRSQKTGRVYWIGNIAPTNPTNPGHPRYPLVIAQVDEDALALKKATVTEIDTRQPGEGERLQLSNFWLIENSETLDLEIYLTRLNEIPDETFTANAYKYTLRFSD
jgi:hypothetical protein